MIDIHTHILPGIDDGSESTEMSLKLIEEASSSGVHSMITTPHFYKGLYENYAGESLQKRWDSLHHAVHRAKLPVHLYQGMEIMACDDLPDLLRDGKVWTLNASAYFLLEFAFDEEPAYCQKIIDACMSSGYTPVIAHPARYYFIQDNPSIVYEWFRQGCGIQLNKGTLLGENGIRARNTAFSLLRHRWSPAWLLMPTEHTGAMPICRVRKIFCWSISDLIIHIFLRKKIPTEYLETWNW